MLHFAKRSCSKIFNMHSSAVMEFEVSCDNSDWSTHMGPGKNGCVRLKGRVRLNGRLR